MKRLGVLTLLLVLVTIPAAFAGGPGWTDTPISIRLLTNKEIYEPGENVEIQLLAVNNTERPITLNFPDGHQQDYCIDSKYLWSSDKSFTEAGTSVDIPARGEYVWSFVHTADDYYLASGPHAIVGTVVGYGDTLPLPIVVREGRRLDISISTPKEVYGVGEEVPIDVIITNNGESEVFIEFNSDREAGYILDGVYREYNGSGFLDIYTRIPLGPGDSHKWEFVHDPADYPLAPGKHSIVGDVVGYGHSEPRVIYVESGLEITVDTDKDEYALDQNVLIFVTATNNSNETMKLEFRSGQQASYSIDEVYHYTDNHAGPLAITEVILRSGESKTWEFTHTPEDYRLLPGRHCIVGIVIGYGKSEPKKIYVADGQPAPIEVSVSTDENEYELGEPVKIDVTAANNSESPVTLHFPTLHKADYRIDEAYLWSRGKFFLPIGISITLPAGGEMTWHFIHTQRDYRLLPGEHSIVGIVVGYGKSEPVTITVKEKEPWQLTVRGLLLKDAPPDPDGGPYGGYPPYFLYTGDPQKVYCLFPQNIDLNPHVNKTVEVTGHYIYTLLPVPGIPLGVTSIRDLLQVEVETDKAKYYQQEDIKITVIARNVTDKTEPETLTIYIDPFWDVAAWVDGIRIPNVDGIMAPDRPYVLVPIQIGPGGTEEWTLVYRGEERPLPPGNYSVVGEVVGYGKSKRLPIEIIEKPVEKIVAEGIVDVLGDNVLMRSDLSFPRYVLVDRLTGEKLYILRNPNMCLSHYLGQYVEVIGVLCQEINYPDVTLGTEEAIPELFVLGMRQLLAVAVSTDKAFFEPTDKITVYVTAKNSTPEEMILEFPSAVQAYYEISGNSAADNLVREANAGPQIVIPPYGVYVWAFTHAWGPPPPELGTYTVTGGVYGYGQAKPVVITLKNDPPAIVTAEGVIEKFWWYRWFEPFPQVECIIPEPWPWIYPCRYVLFDPHEGQILYFLSSHRVPLDWYVGRHVQVTGYPAPDAVILEEPKIEVLPAGEGNGDSGGPNPPFIPPIIWPPVGNHLDVVSVIPLDDNPPPDENGDGIRDPWEIITGLRALGAEKGEDSDGDGVPNEVEFYCGTDPLDPESVVDVKTLVNPAGLVVLRWGTVLGKNYSVYCADGGRSGPLQWRLLVRGIGGTGGEVEWTDDGGSDIPPSNAEGIRCRFYRVEVE